MNEEKPLAGVKVIELGTFIAVPTCARFLAEFGADVIKIEPKTGDNIRFAGVSEGRLGSPYENTTFDLENAHKRGLVLNLKSDEGREILFQMLKDTDVFLTNWRPKALKKLGLDYESLSQKYKRLVYGSLTGYGEEGPDCNLPGYDFTAFWARGGIVGSLMQRGGEPINLAPGMGDHTSGMFLVSGILVALLKAQKTGCGDKVTTSLLHSSVFVQGVPMQAAQYKELGQTYPISRKSAENPFNNTYKTKDNRFLQLSMPPFDLFYPRFMPLIGRADLVGDSRYTMDNITENHLHSEFIGILDEAFSKKTAAEWLEILTAADIPCSLCQVWEEVLEDKQAWANGVFEQVDYPSGKRVMVRPPVRLHSISNRPFERAPLLGENSEDILRELGYSEEQLHELHEKGVYNTFSDVKEFCKG